MESSAPPKPYDFEAEKRDKPWKYESVWALSVLGWIIENASVSLLFRSMVLSSSKPGGVSW